MLLPKMVQDMVLENSLEAMIDVANGYFRYRDQGTFNSQMALGPGLTQAAFRIL